MFLWSGSAGFLLPEIAFFLFLRRKNWHDFVTPFSNFANIKGSLPTKSTTSDRLRCRARQSDEDFTVLKEEKHKKSFFFSRPLPYLILIYTQKKPI